MTEIQSYGGGVQSVALAILNATGRIQDSARLAIMADPGMEEVGTYEHLRIMRPWLGERGVELVVVEGYQGGLKHQGMPLYQWVLELSTVIPSRLARGGLGMRQCTKNWKVDAITREIRDRGYKGAGVQLGISLDEAHRMTDSKVKTIAHRFPLVDLDLTRSDCRQIIRAEGLPIPVKSRCQFCPLQRQESWRVRAAADPEGFERCAQLEDAVIERERRHGRGPAYISSAGKPLREAFATGQAIMTMDGSEEDLCGGYCFT